VGSPARKNLRVPDPDTYRVGGQVLLATPGFALEVLDILAETDADPGPQLNWLVEQRHWLRAEVERRDPKELAQCLATAADCILSKRRAPDDPIIKYLLLGELP
jgi:hypothetical protein